VAKEGNSGDILMNYPISRKVALMLRLALPIVGVCRREAAGSRDWRKDGIAPILADGILKVTGRETPWTNVSSS
jgi:hypothetical protein